jgi:hypothetical protein
LVKDPSLLKEVDPGHVPALLTQLCAVQTSMAAHLVASSSGTEKASGDVLLGVDDAANRLGVSKDWLYSRMLKNGS